LSQAGAEISKSSVINLHWPSALQFVLSSLAILFSWLLTTISLASAAIDIMSGSEDWLANAGMFLSAAGSFSIGIVLIPSAWLALMRLLDRAVRLPAWIESAGKRRQRLSLILFVPVLLIGTYASQSGGIAWLILAPVHLVAVGMIVAWLLRLATRKLERGSDQLQWGAFSSGLTLSPLLAFSAEIIALLFFILIGMFYLGTQPELLGELQDFLNQGTFNSTDPNVLLPAFEPLLSDPVLLILVLGFVSLAVPLIEEIVKPIGVLLLLRRDLKPAEGFVLGALGGAGFAVFEYLTLGASLEGWLPIFTARIGTTAVHMFTAGLMGWAIVKAKVEKRYGLLVGSYALSVLLHGLWNSMAVLGSFATLSALSGASLLPSHLIFSSWLVLFVLAVGSVWLLRKSNLRLQMSDHKEISIKD
jgi:RsiW-degrading membrane proteinase PrsW (M82 family)